MREINYMLRRMRRDQWIVIAGIASVLLLFVMYNNNASSNIDPVRPTVPPSTHKTVCDPQVVCSGILDELVAAQEECKEQQCEPCPTVPSKEAPATGATGSKLSSQRRAVVTLITSEDYILAACTLAYTVQKHNIHAELFAYAVKAISEESLRLVRTAGWKVEIINVIPAPKTPYYRFVDMFTKMLFWNTTQYDIIAYMDSDMIAIGNFDEVFDTPYEFSAVGDYFDKSFTDKFNAGFFVLRPSAERFDELMKLIGDTDKYDVAQAEQGFLNSYYRFSYNRLPYKYNGNLAIYERARSEWDVIKPVTIHYTLIKPFLEINENSNPPEIHRLWFNEKNAMLEKTGLRQDFEQHRQKHPPKH